MNRILTVLRHLLFLIALSLVSAILCGCKSTMCLESDRASQRFSGGERPVFVTNPELKKEYDLLCASKIYTLSNQAEGARHLTLRPMQETGACANSLLLSFFTVGIIPGLVSGGYFFHYDLETDGVEEQYMHTLDVYYRVSLWEWLLIDSTRDDRLLSEALARSQPGPRPIGM